MIEPTHGSGFIEGDDIEWILPSSRLHTWTPCRHARDCQAGDGRFLREQLLDIIRRYMPFDDIAIDHRRMAGRQLGREPKSILFGFHVPGNVVFYMESVGFEVINPCLAAAASRTAVDGDR